MPGLQVDLGVAKTVRGVITQGARSGDAAGGATADNNRAFVRKYKVAHSVNAKDWNFIMDSKTSLPKVGGLGGLLLLFEPANAEKQKLFSLHRFLKETPTTTPRSCATSRRRWPSTSGSTRSAGLRQGLA